MPAPNLKSRAVRHSTLRRMDNPFSIACLSDSTRCAASFAVQDAFRFSFSFVPPSEPIVFVDLETTGGTFGVDRITEIGIVEVGPQGFSQWTSLVNPQKPIPAFIQQLTGITDAMVRDTPTFEELASNLLERMNGRLFIVHNVHFDHGFLKGKFKRVGLRFAPDVLCTV